MSNQELDKKIEAVFIPIAESVCGEWHAGEVGLEAVKVADFRDEIAAIKALIRSELDAVMPERMPMGLPDTLGTAYWNGAIAQFEQNRKVRGL